MNRSVIALFAALCLGACAHKSTAKNDSANGGTMTAVGSTGNKAAATDPNSGDDLSSCGQVRVFFPLNSDQIPAETATSLEKSAKCLKADHALHVTIEGNADERGTEEYNLALGDRRATAVAKYLERLGTSQAQLKTVSYGKEKPLCVEHDEECWTKNRRADLNPDAKVSNKKK